MIRPSLRIAARSAALVTAILVMGCGGGGAASPNRTALGAPRLAASEEPWHLSAPVSAAATLGYRGRILVAGGLTSSNASATGVFLIDPATGASKAFGSLAQPTHDAAAATVGGRPTVFGGGAAAPTSAVQTADGAARTSARLPAPRADLAAVMVRDRVYVVGGYDGNRPSPDILATSDGRGFTSVARLPVPVRYPAVASVGDTIYALGGEEPGGDSTAIQRIDVRSGTARLIGRLPVPVSHASALSFGARVYLIGGRTAGQASARMWQLDTSTGRMSPAGTLPHPVYDAGIAALGSTAYLVGGMASKPSTAVVALRLVAAKSPAHRSTPTPTPHASAFDGRLLIADRGNNRLLLVNSAKRVLWHYPSRTAPAPPGGFYFPDDAFFVRHGTAIISNEEDNHTIVELAFPSGRLLWSYGHAREPGSAAGYLDQPDDAYLLKDGTITVADAKNCRILEIGPAGKPVRQIGTSGICSHSPPRTLAYPNGDTPLSNGDLLVSEIHGSYVDELTRNGQLRWSARLPITYPSDPQQLGPNLYLVADYARPGGVYEFDRSGRIVWAYHPRSGDRMLDHPSLAERLPNGLIGVNDDYRDRVVLIDPQTKQIAWQYGMTDHPGRSRGLLRTPDGFDLLIGSATPTHPQTG